MECIVSGLAETQTLAERFALGRLPCNCKPRSGATVVGLYGNLGAGKTSFTQGVAKAFGIKEYITSPTFVLEKIYKLKRGSPYGRLIHIDAYRLEGGKEMSALGWKEIVKDQKNLIFVEWPERVEDVLPVDMIKIYLETGEKEEERKIRIAC